MVSLVGLLALAAAPRELRAQEVGPSREELASSVHHRPIDKDQGDNPLRGSTFLFEQSMTTQTTQIQPSPEQSYVPLYEIWSELPASLLLQRALERSRPLRLHEGAHE